MEFKVRLTGSTIKALEQVLRQGFRDGERRVIRRVQALLEVGTGRTVPVVAARLGLDAKTVYGRLPVFLVDGPATLRYGRSPGQPSPSHRPTILTAIPHVAGWWKWAIPSSTASAACSSAGKSAPIPISPSSSSPLRSSSITSSVMHVRFPDRLLGRC